MNTAWISRVDAALREVTELRIRLKDAEDRLDAIDRPALPKMLPGQTGWGVLPDGGYAPDFDPVVVKRKPGRPRKNGN